MKIKKARKQQVKFIFKQILDSKQDMLSLDRILININMNWKNLFPISDHTEANLICDKLMKKTFILDINNEIKLYDLIYIYSHLFYLGDFINKSIIQNDLMNKNFSLIQDYLYRYESGLEFIKII